MLKVSWTALPPNPIVIPPSLWNLPFYKVPWPELISCKSSWEVEGTDVCRI